MIKHIVMWNFKPEIKEADKAKIKNEMADNLEALKGKVPGLLEATFIKDPISSSTHDMALVTILDSEEALAGYSQHPDHVHVANTYVRPFVHERCCLDYNE